MDFEYWYEVNETKLAWALSNPYKDKLRSMGQFDDVLALFRTG